jgi:hypothetical protein
MKVEDLIKRIYFALQNGNRALNTKSGEGIRSRVRSDQFSAFRSSGLSVILDIVGAAHPYYEEFGKRVESGWVYCIESGIQILETLRTEFENGWLVSIRELVTAEIFSDFLEMSEHLLLEKYKDAAAVMIGSVLEEHLRQLCTKYAIETYILNGNNQTPKKADQLNSDLAKTNVYNKLDQKSVTAWLGLRNNAAHGKYSEYSQEQVVLFYQGVVDFVARTK